MLAGWTPCCQAGKCANPFFAKLTSCIENIICLSVCAYAREVCTHVHCLYVHVSYVCICACVCLSIRIHKHSQLTFQISSRLVFQHDPHQQRSIWECWRCKQVLLHQLPMYWHPIPSPQQTQIPSTGETKSTTSDAHFSHIHVCMYVCMSVYLIRSYGAPNGAERCSVAQCHDYIWAMLAQSKIELGQYCQC